MKTSVKNLMMSFALMGCLIIGASDASAQGRSRSQGGSTTNRSQSAAVSRNNNSATAPTVSRSTGSSASSSSRSGSAVSRSSSSSSVSRSTSATPQVNRSTSSSSSSRSTSMTTVPQVNRGGNDNRGTGGGTGTRTGNATTRGGNSGSTTVRSGNNGSTGTSTTTITRRSDSGTSISPVGNKTDLNEGKINNTTSRGTTKPNGNRPGGNIDNGRDKGNRGGNGGNIDNGRHGGKPGGNDKPGNIDTGDKGNKGRHGDKGDRHGNRPGDNGRHGGHRGYNPDHHFDYTGHHYHNDFHWNYTHHNWSRPLPPPVRRYRPAPLVWYRPVIPAGWYPYATAPVIDRILGITFGTLFDTSLEFLYYNGYEIDGYADHIIYLRNVPLLNLTWSDVMLCYDSMDRLVNAQFVFYSTHNDNRRYDRVYNSLCRVYGLPFNNSNDGLSWYGGSNTGWVTLTRHNNLGHYYTTLSIGY